MRSVGSRELKSKLSEVLRAVREEREEYVVTHHGRPIARIVPETGTEARALTLDEIWSEMDRLAAEVAREWPEGESAAQAVASDRSKD